MVNICVICDTFLISGGVIMAYVAPRTPKELHRKISKDVIISIIVSLISMAIVISMTVDFLGKNVDSTPQTNTANTEVSIDESSTEVIVK